MSLIERAIKKLADAQQSDLAAAASIAAAARTSQPRVRLVSAGPNLASAAAAAIPIATAQIAAKLASPEPVVPNVVPHVVPNVVPNIAPSIAPSVAPSVPSAKVKAPDPATVTFDQPAAKSASESTGARPSVRKGKPVVVTKEALDAGGFIGPDTVPSRLSQQFRSIKRVLINNAMHRSGDVVEFPRRVMVTSAFPGEGKTFCSVNLALSLARERDLKVLLIDADVPRPRVMKSLGLKSGPGLMDWLQSDNETPDGLIHPTNIGGLAVMSSGKKYSHAAELLSSNETARRLKLLDSVLKHYIILFDSSPLLVTSESLALSRLMGQVVLVVEADKTPRRSVEEASNLLADHPAVSLLLNKQRDDDDSESYGYGKYGHEEN